MRTTDTTPNNCWSCGIELFAASDVQGNARPSEGDISFCIECGAPGIFREDLSTRKPTKEEMDVILKRDDSMKHMLAIRMVHEGMGS